MAKRKNKSRPFEVEITGRQIGGVVSASRELAHAEIREYSGPQLPGVIPTSEYLSATMLTRIEANTGAIARRLEEQVENGNKLNLALGEFREKLVVPLREELKALRYNMGAKVEQTTTELGVFVAHLNTALDALFKGAGWSDERLTHFKQEHGLDSVLAPRAAEFSAYAEQIQQLRDANEQLVAQNQQLRDANEQLVAQNQRLIEEVTTLRATIAQKATRKKRRG